jgi:hypothetical protein
MKSISCKELGGACELVFRGRSFEDVAELSQAHGQEMIAIADGPHLDAIAEMTRILEAGEVESWLQAKMDLFELLPED